MGYYYIAPKLIETNDGSLHALYIGTDESGYNFFEHQQYNGSSWSTIGSKWYAPGNSGIQDLSVCSVGNDIYSYKNYYYGVDYWIDTTTTNIWYDRAPTTPQNMAIGSENQVHVSWSANPEPDLQYYEVWRKYGNKFGTVEDWTLKATTTSTTWTDQEFQLNSIGTRYNVWYKTRAKDLSNNYSAYSSEAYVSAVYTPSKPAVSPDNLTVLNTSKPDNYSIGQNFPNPFNPATKISYALPEPTNVRIVVYDQLGRQVQTLVDSYQDAGFYDVNFDGSRVSSGMYFYEIRAGQFSTVKKMLLMK